MENKNQDAHKASSSDIFDTPNADEKFDLMEMLTEHGYYFPTNTSIFDVIGPPSSVVLPQALETGPELFVPGPALGDITSGIVSTPVTPDNFSMISSSSNETATEDQGGKQIGEDGEEKVDDKNKKLLKPKNMSTKKKKEPRVAFKTVSDIDNMDDGYRWRKYGQKAVKNSPFPRNYYRCTGERCGVKKRVERSAEDPATVVTTYEGTHNHICPMNAPRGSIGIYSKSYGFPGSSSGVGGGMGGSLNIGVGSGNFISGIGGGIVGAGGDIRSSLSSGIGGNVSNDISGHGGGSIGGRFSSGYDGSICGTGGGMAGSFNGRTCGASDKIGGDSGGIGGSFSTGSGGNYNARIGGASGDIGGGMTGSFNDRTYGASDNIGGASGGIGGNYSASIGGVSGGIGGDMAGSFNGRTCGASDNIGGASGGIGGNYSASIGGASGGIGGDMAGCFNARTCGACDNIGGACGGIVGSFGTSYSAGIGAASGSIGGRFSGGNGTRAFSYGLGGANSSSGIGSASGSIGGNFTGGGSFSSGISTSSKGDIVDNLSIGNHAITGSDISSGDIKLPYAIEQLASYQHKPHLYNNPSLSSYTFGAATATVSTATAGTAATSSATTGTFGSSFENDDFFSLKMYEELAMLPQHALLEDMLAPQMQEEKEKDQE